MKSTWHHLVSFFYIGGFLTKYVIVFVERPKHAIERSENNTFSPSAGPYIALNQTAEIVDVNVPVTHFFLKGEVHGIDGILAVVIGGTSSGVVLEMVSKR